MSLTQKVAYNLFAQALGKFISTILGIITIAMITRYLGAEGFGNYTTVMTYLMFFGIVIEFGMHLTTVQLASSDVKNKEKIIQNIFTLRIISAIIFFGFAPLLIWVFPYPYSVKIGVLITTISYLCVAINQIFVAIMQMELKTEKIALGEVIGRAVLLLLTAISIIFNLGFYYIMGSVVFGNIANVFISYYYVRQYTKLSFRFNFYIWKKILIASLPIGISIIFNLIYLKADMLILSLYKSQFDVGIYGATYKFLDILTTFPAMFMGLALPILTKHWVDNNIEGFKRVFQKSFDLLIILSVPIIFGTYFTAEKIILLISGKDFLAAVPVLQIIIVSVLAIFVGGGLYGYTIIALKQQKKMMWGYIVTAIISLVLYLIFIPRYSYFGAAGVTIFSEYFISILIIYMVYKITKVKPDFAVFYKSILASLIMSAFLYLLWNQNLFILLSVGIIVYIIAIYILKGVKKEMILDIIKFRKNY